uniref:Uncharacterized protein n=1 Tax=Anopheles farauti TaxID=69004 RepID=A0A182Q0F0_9DIPT
MQPRPSQRSKASKKGELISWRQDFVIYYDHDRVEPPPPPPGPGPALPIAGSADSSIDEEDDEEDDPDDEEEEDEEDGEHGPSVAPTAPPTAIGSAPFVSPTEPSICVFTTKSRSRLDVYCCVGLASPRMLSASEPLSTRRMAALTRAGSSLSLEQEPPSAVSPPSADGKAPCCFAGVDVERGGLLSSNAPSPTSLAEEDIFPELQVPFANPLPGSLFEALFTFDRTAEKPLSSSSEELESEEKDELGELESLSLSLFFLRPEPSVPDVAAGRLSHFGWSVLLRSDADDESESLEESDPSSESDDEEEDDEEDRGDLALSAGLVVSVELLFTMVILTHHNDGRKSLEQDVYT